MYKDGILFPNAPGGDLPKGPGPAGTALGRVRYVRMGMQSIPRFPRKGVKGQAPISKGQLWLAQLEDPGSLSKDLDYRDPVAVSRKILIRRAYSSSLISPTAYFFLRASSAASCRSVCRRV